MEKFLVILTAFMAVLFLFIELVESNRTIQRDIADDIEYIRRSLGELEEGLKNGDSH